MENSQVAIRDGHAELVKVFDAEQESEDPVEGARAKEAGVTALVHEHQHSDREQRQQHDDRGGQPLGNRDAPDGCPPQERHRNQGGQGLEQGPAVA